MTEVYDWKMNEDGCSCALFVRRASGERWEHYGSRFRVQYQFDLGILEWMGKGELPDWLEVNA